jgi:hypothetical protein
MTQAAAVNKWIAQLASTAPLLTSLLDLAEIVHTNG